jgi:hypothetical protein
MNNYSAFVVLYHKAMQINIDEALAQIKKRVPNY